MPECAKCPGFEQWMSTTDAKQRLGCSRQNVDKLVRAGRLEGCRDAGGRIRISPDSVERWLEANRPAEAVRITALEIEVRELRQAVSEALRDRTRTEDAGRNRAESMREAALHLKAALARYKDADRQRSKVQRLLLEALEADRVAFEKMADVVESHDEALTQLLMPDSVDEP